MISKEHRKEKGNALFLILIAVVLFAALSYAVTNSSGGGGINKEKLVLEAAQIIDYVTEIRTAIMRMRIINDCSDTDINFAQPQVGGYVNPTSPTDKSCDVFDINGGGMSYKKPKDEWLATISPLPSNYKEFLFTGQSCIAGVGKGVDFNCWNDSDLSNQELLIFLPWISKEMCIHLNNKLGIVNPGGNPPQDFGSMWNTSNLKFVGTYTEDSAPWYGAANDGLLSVCMEGDTQPPAGTYHFYHVLLAR